MTNQDSERGSSELTRLKNSNALKFPTNYKVYVVCFVCLFVIVGSRKMSKMAVFDWLFDFLTTFLNVSGRGKKRILEFSPLSIGRGGFTGFRLLSRMGIPLFSEPIAPFFQFFQRKWAKYAIKMKKIGVSPDYTNF